MMRMKLVLSIFAIVSISLIIALPMSCFTEEVSSKFLLKTYSEFTGYAEPPLTVIIFDDDGIPYANYRSTVGIQRNPVFISLAANNYEREYLNGNKSSRQYLLNCADWLLMNKIIYDNFSLWEYSFEFNYNMTPPWRSGMAQGLGLQALAKAYNLTKEKKYIDAGSLVINSFYIPLDEGGITYKESYGWWFEEYADENGSNPRILNGMIYSLLGLHEYYLVTGDKRALFLFEKGIDSLHKHIAEYDAKWWTYYDCLGNLSSKKYHHIHIDQMGDLYNITGDPSFKEYHDKWENYENSPILFLNKLYHQPSKLGFAIYFFNVSIIFAILNSLTILAAIRNGKLK